MEQEYKFTQKEYDAMKEELVEKRTTGRADVAEKIREAKSFGDLSENSEYDEAKSEQGKLEASITELEYILNHAVIVDENDINSDKVHTGTKVKIENTKTGKLSTYDIVGFPQADPINGKISDESPVGKALLGHETGEEVEVELPNGAKVFYRILEISLSAE